GQLLGELHAAGASPDVVSAVRRHFTQENFHAYASRRLIGAGIDDNVNDVSPVSEVILETQIRGTAHTIGKVSLRTVPSNSHAVLDILMNGYAYSRNVGHNGPVTLHTNGTTSLSAYKRLVLDANGLHS
ncbi:MAG TPA: hypothetical protein VL096_03120, partial [Pirellulaceae bacterium]|nr:hypothetical protein [Pirellulaceae bacterium]